MSENHYAVVMAGGVGTRFWPVSTKKYPKQFHDILGVGKSMIQQTYERLRKLLPAEHIFVITNREYIDLTASHLPELPKANIVGEPIMKNTAACNYYMAEKISHLNPNAVLAMVPSDHLILKEDVFTEKLNTAFHLAEAHSSLITLGIQPTRPDTGYGYIQYVPGSAEELFKVKTFTEKPNEELAQTFLDSGDFLWNAGIFIWSVSSIKDAFQKYLPEMTEEFKTCEYQTEREADCISYIYPKLPNISIDHAILEKAENVYVIPADLGWSDLGTWTSVFENKEKDENGNVCSPKTYILTENTKASIIKTTQKDKLIYVDGLENFIIVDTESVLLISPIQKDQNIREKVQMVKTLKKGDQYI